LGRRAFKQTSAAARKKGVAAKKQRVLTGRLRPKSDVTQGVTRNIVDFKTQAVPVESVALLQATGLHGHFFEGRSDHLRPRLGHQISKAARVVRMVVRD